MPIFLVCQTGVHAGKHLPVTEGKPLIFKLLKNNKDAGRASVELHNDQIIFTNQSSLPGQVNGKEHQRTVVSAGDHLLIHKDVFLVEGESDTSPSGHGSTPATAPARNRPAPGIADTIVPTRPAPISGAADTVIPTRPPHRHQPQRSTGIADTIVPTRPAPISGAADTVIPTRPPRKVN